MKEQASHLKGPRLPDVLCGVMVAVGIYAVVRHGSAFMAYLITQIQAEGLSGPNSPRPEVIDPP